MTKNLPYSRLHAVKVVQHPWMMSLDVCERASQSPKTNHYTHSLESVHDFHHRMHADVDMVNVHSSKSFPRCSQVQSKIFRQRVDAGCMLPALFVHDREFNSLGIIYQRPHTLSPNAFRKWMLHVARNRE